MKRQRPNVLALVAIALLALAARATVALSQTHSPPLRRAVGLRDATVLPSGLTDSPAPAIRLKDPRGDTLANVRSWLRLHREPANFHYLIGSERELEPAWHAYFVAPQIPGDPNSSHTASIWLVNRNGQRQAEINAGAPVSPGDLAYDFRVLLR